MNETNPDEGLNLACWGCWALVILLLPVTLTVKFFLWATESTP